MDGAPCQAQNRRVSPRRFTLLDDVYYEALLAVADALAREGLPFCLVGGGASQAWIAALRTGQGARRLDDEPLLGTALRKTRDLDFATRAAPDEMLRILNVLASAGAGGHVLGPRTLRLGPVSVSLTLGPAELSGMEALYDSFLASRTALRLRRGSGTDEVPAIGLEGLLVTKLTRRGDKAKDLFDLAQILTAARDVGRWPDLEAVRATLAGRSEALALLAEIVNDLGGGVTKDNT